MPNISDLSEKKAEDTADKAEKKRADEAAAAAKKVEDDAKKKADLEAKEAAEVAEWQKTAVGKHVTEHLNVLQDRTGGRHRKG